LLCKNTGDSGQRLLHAITNLCNLMLTGKVISEMRPYIYGASLCALSKKDGGIRPIAIGSTFRRLVSKVCRHRVKDTLSTFFQPIQIGFGIKGGGEAAVHSIRKYIKNQSDAEVILKIDVKNPFNSVERDSILSMVKDITPDLFPYLWQCYTFQSNLFFNNNIIESLVGCQQGDPLGRAIFSLSIHRIIKNLTSELNIWYLDDGTLGGKASDVLHDLEKIICDFKKIGLTLNFNKCELYFLIPFLRTINLFLWINFNP
jgi:hypothetical protein